jgi:hypothetical protein
VLLVAASVWDIVPAVASVVVATAALIVALQLSRLQHARTEFERRAFEARVAERSVELARLETERLFAELLRQRLMGEALVVPPRLGAERARTATLSRGDIESSQRKLSFLARKRIESIAAADAATETSPSDLSFAAGAAELFGRAIASREDGA